MAVKFAGLTVLIVAAAFMFSIVAANKNCTTNNSTAAGNWNHSSSTNGGYYPWGGYNRPKNATTIQNPNRFIVGGPDNNWHFGFNYTEWAIKNGPFYLNDTLVFKYDPPNGTVFPHSVYLLPNIWSFQNCDLRGAKKIGEVSQGAGEGFEFVLKRWQQPYYFACGERNGFHCKVGLMKFSVWPLIRSTYN